MEIERLRRQLAKHKKKNQKLTEIVHGNSHPHHCRVLRLITSTLDSHGDTYDSDPESEEPNEDPSPMQFSTAVSIGLLELALFWE